MMLSVQREVLLLYLPSTYVLYKHSRYLPAIPGIEWPKTSVVTATSGT